MREIGHFVGGKHVKGTSGRFGDVFDPNTGEVQAKVALAKHSEVEHAIAVAEAAQPDWAATNPQRRARVLMKFVDLLNRDMDKLAEALSREHGKTLPDAAGDVQRGLEVVEYCIGAPQLLKGEFSRNVGPSIDSYSDRQALGVVAGIALVAAVLIGVFALFALLAEKAILRPHRALNAHKQRLAELALIRGRQADGDDRGEGEDKAWNDLVDPRTAEEARVPAEADPGDHRDRADHQAGDRAGAPAPHTHRCRDGCQKGTAHWCSNQGDRRSPKQAALTFRPRWDRLPGYADPAPP